MLMFYVYCLLGLWYYPGTRIGYTYGWRYAGDLAW